MARRFEASIFRLSLEPVRSVTFAEFYKGGPIPVVLYQVVMKRLQRSYSRCDGFGFQVFALASGENRLHILETHIFPKLLSSC